MKRPILYNSKTSKGYRRELRRNLTPAEALLRSNLKNASLEGRRFHHIADFYCPQCRLIVELDGAVHEGLLEIGIRVIRFENTE